MMTLCWRGHDIEIRDEPTYSRRSTDNPRAYACEVALDGADSHASSRHGVTVRHRERDIASCIVLATGGGTIVHGRSAVVKGDGLYLAVGRQLCALALPPLGLHWHMEADAAKCFGGRDIFTGELTIDTAGVEVSDWNGVRYRFDLETGEPSQPRA